MDAYGLDYGDFIAWFENGDRIEFTVSKNGELYGVFRIQYYDSRSVHFNLTIQRMEEVQYLLANMTDSYRLVRIVINNVDFGVKKNIPIRRSLSRYPEDVAVICGEI